MTAPPAAPSEQWPEADARGPLMSRPGAIAFAVGSAVWWMLMGSGMFAKLASTGSGIAALLAGIVWLAPVLLAPIAILGAKARVRVGADGVSWRSWGRERFLAFADVETIDFRQGRIVLRTNKGKLHFIELTAQRGSASLRAEESTIARALVAAFERWKAPRERHALEEELTQGKRTVGEWLAALEARASSKGDYRSAALEKETLVAIASDGAAEPTARAAAAWILRRVGAERHELSQLAAAASGAASPRVRVVLEAAADETANAEVVARTIESRKRQTAVSS